MEIKDMRIDGGKAFDRGRASKEYAMFRDIYPEIFYKKIKDNGITGKKIKNQGEIYANSKHNRNSLRRTGHSQN